MCMRKTSKSANIAKVCKDLVMYIKYHTLSNAKTISSDLHDKKCSV